MATCVTCTHYSLRDHPKTTDEKSIRSAAEMAKKHGLGRCLKGAGHRFLSPSAERECRRHQPADLATTEQRTAWLAKRAGHTS